MYNEGCFTYILPDIFGNFCTVGFNFWQCGHVRHFEAYLNTLLNIVKRAM